MFTRVAALALVGLLVPISAAAPLRAGQGGPAAAGFGRSVTEASQEAEEFLEISYQGQKIRVPLTADGVQDIPLGPSSWRLHISSTPAGEAPRADGLLDGTRQIAPVLAAPERGFQLSRETLIFGGLLSVTVIGLLTYMFVV